MRDAPGLHLFWVSRCIALFDDPLEYVILTVAINVSLWLITRYREFMIAKDDSLEEAGHNKGLPSSDISANALGPMVCKRLCPHYNHSFPATLLKVPIMV